MVKRYNGEKKETWRDDRDEQWEEFRREGGSLSRDEFEYQCDIDDYGSDESDNDPWDE